MKRPAAGHVEIFSPGAIYIVHKVENAFIVAVCGLQQDGSRAIPKQHAGRAVLIIQNGSHHVASDDQRFFLSAGAHKLCTDRQGIQKSGTGGRKIESPRVRSAQFVLNQAGGRRKHHVRRHAGDHD